MLRSRNARWVGVLVALTLALISTSCTQDSEASTSTTCPTQEQIDQAVSDAADLREEADGLDGGQGRQAREEASDAETEAESLQTTFDSDECVAERDTTTPTTEATNEEADSDQAAPETSGDVTVEVDSESLSEIFDGRVFADELAFGPDAEAAMVDAPQERGAAAHSRETLRTPEELTAWLNGSDPRAQDVYNRVALAIGAKCGAEDVSVHLDDSQGWLLMVVRPGSQILGTSYVNNGGIEFADTWREVGANDAYWIPVCTQGAHRGEVVPNGIVRADCGNGSENPKIRIIRSNTPPAPPVTEPPPECPPSMPYGYWNGNRWICKDRPSNDPGATGNAPPPVTGVAPPVNGPATPPAAGNPPATYHPPAPPTTAAPNPPVTAPPTTSPPATTPPTTTPPQTTIPAPR